MGSNPVAVHWMDMSFFTLICCTILYCLFEKTKNKPKIGLAHFLKKQSVNKRPYVCARGKLEQKIGRWVLVDQCDQMSILFFQYSPICHNENEAISIENVQIEFNILPNN